jgi:GT2 family glycosyltransferase
MKEPIDLSVIIVNWKSAQYLPGCLASLKNACRNVGFEVIVVDNASFDGSQKCINDKSARARFLQLNENRGFGAANNQGRKIALGKYLLFLNPDTIVSETGVECLLTVLANGPRIGCVGAKLLNRNRSVQTSALLPFPTIINQVLDMEALKKRSTWLPFWGNGPLYRANATPTQVQAISGACMLIKSDIFDMVGGFSGEYFMYAEDIDLCYKIKKAGYAVFYAPQAEIIHFGGGSTASTGFSKFPIVVMKESDYIFIKKSRGVIYAKTFRLAVLLAALIRLMLLCIASPALLGKGKVARLRWSMAKWIATLRWAMGLENGYLKMIGYHDEINR